MARLIGSKRRCLLPSHKELAELLRETFSKSFEEAVELDIKFLDPTKQYVVRLGDFGGELLEVIPDDE